MTQKIRYNAVVDGVQYTIVGEETTEHLDLVTQLVDEQYQLLKQNLVNASGEQTAVLLAINVMSDYLKKQTEALILAKKNEEFRVRLAALEEKNSALEQELVRANSAENEARRLLAEIESETLQAKEEQVAFEVERANQEAKKKILEKSQK